MVQLFLRRVTFSYMSDVNNQVTYVVLDVGYIISWDQLGLVAMIKQGKLSIRTSSVQIRKHKSSL